MSNRVSFLLCVLGGCLIGLAFSLAENVDAAYLRKHVRGLQGVGLPLSGALPMAGPLDMDGNDIENVDDVFGDAITTDAAPRVTVFGSQPIYTAPGATNVTGANIVWAPSPGERTLEGVTRAASTGDTLTFDVYANGVVTQTVKTEGAASPDGWDCDGAASDIICVCNLYDLLVGAGAITGVTVTRTDATCSDEKLTFTIVPGTSEYLTVATSDDTNVDMTVGADGQIVMPRGNTNSLSLVFVGDPDTGFYWLSANNFIVETNGTIAMQFGPNFNSSGRHWDFGGKYVIDFSKALSLGGNCTVGGTGDVCTSAALDVATGLTVGSIASDAGLTFVSQTIGVPFSAMRVFDNTAALLPVAGATDDLGFLSGLAGPSAPSLQTEDLKAAGATNNRAYFELIVPSTYLAGSTVTLRLRAGMLTTAADTSATLDAECWVPDYANDDGSVSSDLVTPAPQNINSTTLANIDFVIDDDLSGHALTAGSLVQCQITTAINDGATGTAVIGIIRRIDVLIST